MKVHTVLYAYALFLFGGGFYGFHAAGYAAKAKSSIIMGTASAACSLVCAVLSDSGSGAPPAKGEPGYKKWMIGVHLGLMLPLLFAPVFGWRVRRRSQLPREHLLPIRHRLP